MISFGWLRLLTGRLDRRHSPTRRSRRARSPSIPLRIEGLEARLALHGDDGLLAQSTQLTLSFAPDGTDVAGQPSTLFSQLDTAFARQDWQQAVLSGFQTWLVHTAADLGVVPDEGLPLGTLGPTTGDTRFGDIRVAARPLANDVLAISMSQDALLSGSWAGDVILNSQAEFHSLDEFYSVVLHEAGHVLGLPHSEDPASPMHVHGASTALSLTQADILAVQQRHGQRLLELIANDQLSQATRLNWPAAPGDLEGRAPALSFGEISPESDVDFYEVRAVDRDDGPLTVRLRTHAVSQLVPQLSIFNEQGSLLQQADAAGLADRDITLTLPNTVLGDSYFIEVRAAAEGLASVGSYALVVTQDDRLVVDLSTIDRWISGPLRLLTEDDISSLFDDDDGLVREEDHADDEAATAMELKPTAEFSTNVRYDTLGSLTDDGDTDFYKFDSPEFTTPLVMHIAVRSLQPGRLVPSVTLLAGEGDPQPFEVLVNGGGELLLQSIDVDSDREYRVQVSAAPGSSLLQSGNYELTVSFSAQTIDVPMLASGVVPSADAPQFHALYVARPQLFHFALTSDTLPVVGGQGLLLTIRDAQGRLVHRIAASPGETRTAGSALLLPGQYVVRVDPLVLPGHAFVATGYMIRGRATSDPLGVDPVDPSDLEYACPDLPGWFCYPGGIISEVPFLWDTFLDTLPVDPPLDPVEQVSTLLGDWWRWYWQTTPGNGPPLAVDDAYQVSPRNPLRVEAAAGVLANDVDAEANELSSVLFAPPGHGTVQLDLDGGFSYVPATDFVGMDSFQYQALDFFGESNMARVVVRVGSPDVERADFNGDGAVDGADLQQLAEGLRTEAGLRFDLNLDGKLDAEDWRVMIYDILQSRFGDANLDGRFNSADLVKVFQAGEYEDDLTGNASWSTGDWNGDAEFSSGDLVLAFQLGAYEMESPPRTAQAAALDFIWNHAFDGRRNGNRDRESFAVVSAIRGLPV